MGFPLWIQQTLAYTVRSALQQQCLWIPECHLSLWILLWSTEPVLSPMSRISLCIILTVRVSWKRYAVLLNSSLNRRNQTSKHNVVLAGEVTWMLLSHLNLYSFCICSNSDELYCKDVLIFAKERHEKCQHKSQDYETGEHCISLTYTYRPVNFTASWTPWFMTYSSCSFISFLTDS